MEQNAYLELMKDEVFRAGLSAYLDEKQPQTREERYAAVIAFAASKGHALTVEELAASEAANREMDDSELENVAGGWCWSNNLCSNVIKFKGDNKECSTSYKRGEICIITDSCENVVNYYKIDQRCNTTFNPHSYCNVNDNCTVSVTKYN